MLFSFVGIAFAATTITLDNPTAVGSTGTVDETENYIGNGSWKNDGSKFSLWLTPEDLFGSGSSFTIADIKEISYHTLKQTTQGGLNFYINIYTDQYSGGSTSWYGSRLTLEPMYSYSFSDVVGTWNEWTTNNGTNQLTVFDAPRSGAYGWYYPPTLTDIQAGAINWNSYLGTAPVTSIDYSGETVKYIVIDTGSAWTAGFEGNVDALTITLNDDTSVNVDLEPPFIRSAKITSPAGGEEVSGSVSFDAILTDDDTDDSVQWAVREGTCDAGVGTVFGNVDGFNDSSTWINNVFNAVADTTTWTPGDYCFIFNPTEGGGEANIRETREFTVRAPYKSEILMGSGVPGKGLENAPGLQKTFNPKSKAAENAGKK